MDIYVGNMSYSSTAETLKSLFEQHGAVASVKIVTDRDTGRPRGFAFVSMPNDDEARAAISAIDGREVEGRTLKVNEAQPKQNRGPGDRMGPRPPRRPSW